MGIEPTTIVLHPYANAPRRPRKVIIRKGLKCVLDVLRAEWRNSTPRFASTPERRNEKNNVNKYTSLPRVGIEPTTSRFHSHTLYLCATTGLIFTLRTCVSMIIRKVQSTAFRRGARW